MLRQQYSGHLRILGCRINTEPSSWPKYNLFTWRKFHFAEEYFHKLRGSKLLEVFDNRSVYVKDSEKCDSQLRFSQPQNIYLYFWRFADLTFSGRAWASYWLLVCGKGVLCMKFLFPGVFENVLFRRVLSSRFVEAAQLLGLEMIFTFRREIKFKRRVGTKNNDADGRSDEGMYVKRTNDKC